jgi:hypothetical protein
MDEIASVVRHRTQIGKGYARNAGVESIELYLADWRQARARLNQQIDLMERLRADRLPVGDVADQLPVGSVDSGP